MIHRGDADSKKKTKKITLKGSTTCQRYTYQTFSQSPSYLKGLEQKLNQIIWLWIALESIKKIYPKNLQNQKESFFPRDNFLILNKFDIFIEF